MGRASLELLIFSFCLLTAFTAQQNRSYREPGKLSANPVHFLQLLKTGSIAGHGKIALGC